eukprot:g2434.t1
MRRIQQEHKEAVQAMVDEQPAPAPDNPRISDELKALREQLMATTTAMQAMQKEVSSITQMVAKVTMEQSQIAVAAPTILPNPIPKDSPERAVVARFNYRQAGDTWFQREFPRKGVMKKVENGRCRNDWTLDDHFFKLAKHETAVHD